jgi:hypothetical protein
MIFFYLKKLYIQFILGFYAGFNTNKVIDILICKLSDHIVIDKTKVRSLVFAEDRFGFHKLEHTFTNLLKNSKIYLLFKLIAIGSIICILCNINLAFIWDLYALYILL